MTSPVPLRARVEEVLRVVRRIIGAPDYEGYLAHATAAHPGQKPLSREEFIQRRLEDRYCKPGGKCC
jgi:uncharacterized short protein YbdD (DUF466 family)